MVDATLAPVGYSVRLGSLSADDGARSDFGLVRLSVELTMDGAGGCARLWITPPEVAPPELGADVEIELNGGGGRVPVFAGKLDELEIAPTEWAAVATDGLASLARLDVEAAYEKAAVDVILKDLLKRAKLKAGKIARGPELPAYVLRSGPRALRHARELAALLGADLFVDEEGAVQVEAPKAGSADHSFRYGEDVLAFELRAGVAAYDGVEVWGEGAAASKGAARAHWLPTKLDGVSGKASMDAKGKVTAGQAGKTPRRVVDGALRAAAACKDVAKARMTALAARRFTGSLETFGAPDCRLGQRVAVQNLPRDHAAADLAKDAGTLRIRRVVHRLDAERGLLTRLEF